MISFLFVNSDSVNSKIWNYFNTDDEKLRPIPDVQQIVLYGSCSYFLLLVSPFKVDKQRYTEIDPSCFGFNWEMLVCQCTH